VHSAKNYLISFLVLTTVAGGVIAWRQYQELISLRAAALSPNERADWQKRLWDAEKKRSDLETRVAHEEKEEPGDTPSEAPPENGPPAGRQRIGRNELRNEFAAMMDRPEVQRLMALQQRAALDARYADLFKSLNLSPEQLEKFKNLLVEKSTAVMDVMAAAREQGTNPRTDRDTFRKLVADAQADVDASIRATLGEAGFSQYKEYEQTQPQRSVVDQLAQRLSYSSTPLSSEQAAQMVKILETTSQTQRGGNNRVFIGGGGPMQLAVGGGGGSARVPVTDATINQALGVLAAPQVDALRQLQQEQQAQAQLSAAMRKQFQESRANAATGATSTVPTPTAPKAGGGG